MNVEEETMKSIRYIPFSGKSKDWHQWSLTFLATASMRGYIDVLKPKDPSKKIKEADNRKAYNDLLVSCQEPVTFGIIAESRTSEFPEGDARIAWKKLGQCFEPKTGSAKVELRKEFQQS